MHSCAVSTGLSISSACEAALPAASEERSSSSERIYFFVIANDNRVFTKKVVIIH